MGDCNLSHVTSVGKVVIARTHITVLARLCDAETRRITGGWRVIKLSLQFVTSVTTCVEVKVQLFGVKFTVHVINDIKRQAGASFGFHRTASFLYPTHVGAICAWRANKRVPQIWRRSQMKYITVYRLRSCCQQLHMQTEVLALFIIFISIIFIVFNNSSLGVI